MDIGGFPRDLDALFNPSSVAVVGASNSLGKWGFVMPVSIIGGGYPGRLFMVNPSEETVLGMPSYPSLVAIGEKIDLVIVTIPARKVKAVIEEAAALGVKNALVVASNFSEAGEEGIALERELAEAADGAGVSIIGPNTMGAFSAPASFCALGAPTFPLAGRVGFISQSGNLGVQLLEWAGRRGVGFSRFVGSGNEANTHMTDFLEYLGSDRETDVIALYIEGLDDGRAFLEAAFEVTRKKPVIVLKGGRGRQGARAVSSHSGAMAGSLEIYQAAFDQAGVITAESSEDFLDLVTAFSSLPAPRGGRVAIMTMGGGWGVVAADACDREGVELAKLPDGVIEEIDSLLPAYWSRGNPVDLVGNLRRANHFKVIDALVRCEEVDLLIIMGAVLGKEMLMHNLTFMLLRPLFVLGRKSLTALHRFVSSLRSGFAKSVSDRNVKNPEGSVGIDPLELWNWTDTALVGHLKKLMAENNKPIITVSMSDARKSSFRRLGSRGIFTTPMPERAVHIAAKLIQHAR